ncbi:MAG: glutamine--fructose-6-phosphate transaminase (isomerizing) [Bdellovibrionaceae bacterium]|nr:glutamine--fructose-6-phosphate transaminase (isomerizing) [Pseudobdellovibrionaceae bacterium]|tara:strand:- start:37211 stop:39097 length:1887 start_codon:yes stop_codon:yes gene_type:complete
MCGIVGYLGEKDPKEVIYKGLKTLEYRGYDSAGMAILDGEHFRRVRAQGKLNNLWAKIEKDSFSGSVGIGHTRWATHGIPNEANAHPHAVETVTIVHNGIIENYQELKAELAKTGSKFSSDTDSELVAHLIYNQMQSGQGLLEAVFEVIPRLIGAYSILAVSEDSPDEVVAFKNGPPLLVGMGENEMVVASDIQAIVPYTQTVFYLEDNEVAHIKQDSVKFMDTAGVAVKKVPEEVEWNQEQVEKGGYPYFMLKEIYEQPRAVAQAIEPHIDLKNKSVRLAGVGFGIDKYEDLSKLDRDADWQKTLSAFSQVERIFIVACGTSYYAGMVGEYLIERITGIPVEVDVASEFRYRHPVIPKNSLMIVVSQSGETADTLAALRNVKKSGAMTLSICNVSRSSIDREADGHLYMNAGVEVGVASTKAFVSTLALFNLLALSFGKAKGCLETATEQQWIEDLLGAPAQMEKVLAYDKYFDEAGNDLKEYKGFLYMGRGVNYPIALEGALKLKELAYMHAEGYAAGEMKHGPLALIDNKMAVVMMCPQDELYEKTFSNLEEARARGGMVISIGSGVDEKLKNMSEHYLSLPESRWYVNPLLEVIPLQLLAYHVAHRLGHDVDQPRNLAKSVTVE